MIETIKADLEDLRREGNLRIIPSDDLPMEGIVDLSSNDYLGLGRRHDLMQEFLDTIGRSHSLTASASRLLASKQSAFSSLENTLEETYGDGWRALLFNSGYHANTGLIAPLCTRNTVILADKLVHASIIDGIKLSGARFERFQHNSVEHLKRLCEKYVKEGMSPLIIVESIYSMDGDKAPLEEIANLKRDLAPEGILFVDEAHAVGVEGPSGLGLAHLVEGVNIIVGTFGKALASSGAFALMKCPLRDWMVNKSRSLIFSTVIPPLQAAWSEFTFTRTISMDAERQHLRSLGLHLASILRCYSTNGVIVSDSHIQPLIVGDPVKAISLSGSLKSKGFNVLPIRRPTVPPGTDRLRFSLSADISFESIELLKNALSTTL